MTFNQVPKILDQLNSKDVQIRNDAIKAIITRRIDDIQIVTALNNIIQNDPYMTLRNFARSALDILNVPHSAMEEPVKIEKVVDDNVAVDQPSYDIIDEQKRFGVLRLITIIYGLIFIPSLFCASQAGYIFDGGYTSENRIGYILIVSFPVTILVSIAVAWGLFKAQKYDLPFMILLIPVIHFLFLLGI